MKSGLEQRGKVIAAVLLGVVALVLVWTSGGSRSTPATAATTANAPAAPKAKTQSRTGTQRRVRDRDRQGTAERSLDPTLRVDMLKVSEAVEYKGGKRNIFSMQSELPPPVQQVAKGPKCPGGPGCPPPPPVCPGPDPRCPPPPIPLQFFGFASRPGEPKRIFLRTTDTNDVFVAAEGEIVNRRYRVVRITGAGVEVEDVLNNNKQVLPLQQG